MIKNDLSKIFNALKDHHDKKLVLYKKICRHQFTFNRVSLLQHVHDFTWWCCKHLQRITIDNVVSLNVCENPSFCCTLYVFKNGISTPWLSLKLSSIKNSGLGVFSLQNLRRSNSLLVISVKLMKILLMKSILSRRLMAIPWNLHLVY